MNKQILFVMRSLDNPELFTKEEKEANKESAAADNYAAYAATYADTKAAPDTANAAYWNNDSSGRYQLYMQELS